MTKVVAITQARYGSTRLPAKVLRKIKDKILLQIHLERASKASLVNKLIVATTVEPEASAIADVAKNMGIAVSHGSIDDVLERYYMAAKPENPDYVVRITSDCPLIDPVLMDKTITLCIEQGVDYVSTNLVPLFPDGVDVEVFKFSALEKAYHEATLKSDREHVTPYIWKNTDFKGGSLFTALPLKQNDDYSNYRLTVDTIEDFELVEKLIDALGDKEPWMKYVEYLNQHSALLDINKHHTRNEGYIKSLKNDDKTNDQ